MPRAVFFEWDGTEYSFEQKGADWYWALGLIVVAVVVACILFGNILLALVTIAGATTLALVAARPPGTHHFAIRDDGVAIDETLYRYEDMLTFSVLEYADPNWPPSLSIKTKHLLAPHLLIPINDHDPLAIYEFFSAHVEEGRHEDSLIDRVIELLRL